MQLALITSEAQDALIDLINMFCLSQLMAT